MFHHRSVIFWVLFTRLSPFITAL